MSHSNYSTASGTDFGGNGGSAFSPPFPHPEGGMFPSAGLTPDHLAALALLNMSARASEKLHRITSASFGSSSGSSGPNSVTTDGNDSDRIAPRTSPSNSGSSNGDSDEPLALCVKRPRLSGSAVEVVRERTLSESSSIKMEPRFWQYNSKAKGPKVERYQLNISGELNPRERPKFIDPVFDDRYDLPITNVGKVRRGDANDMTANPEKLYSLGQQLEAINDDIEKLTNSADPREKKEKARLVSKACRLKKKANNEANKIKLYLLQKEHEELNKLIADIKDEVDSVERDPSSQGPLCPRVRRLISTKHTTKAMGNTSELLDDIIRRVGEGDSTGGL